MKIKELRQNLGERLIEQGWEHEFKCKGRDFALFAKKDEQAFRMNLMNLKELFKDLSAGRRLTAWKNLGDKLIFELEKQLTTNVIKDEAIKQMDKKREEGDIVDLKPTQCQKKDTSQPKSTKKATKSQKDT